MHVAPVGVFFIFFTFSSLRTHLVVKKARSQWNGVPQNDCYHRRMKARVPSNMRHHVNGHKTRGPRFCPRPHESVHPRYPKSSEDRNIL